MYQKDMTLREIKFERIDIQIVVSCIKSVSTFMSNYIYDNHMVAINQPAGNVYYIYLIP